VANRAWRWRRCVPPQRRLTFNGLQDVIYQKIVLFITIAVRLTLSTTKFTRYKTNTADAVSCLLKTLNLIVTGSNIKPMLF
jgi:hypothetical protein